MKLKRLKSPIGILDGPKTQLNLKIKIEKEKCWGLDL